MSAWKGDPTNPVPNSSREGDNLSEKPIGENRANQIRRDNDNQKDFTISLYDIDETILEHLGHLQLQVDDVGKKINVPYFFASPEQWVSAQRDGYLRDKQGKLILPLITIKRVSSENDQTLQFFNRYLTTPALKLYSNKNRYTQFSLLTGQNKPIHELYNIVVPSHMVLTYKFVIWTEYAQQMNDLVSKFQFNTKDYWGNKKGFRFRTRIESFGHTVEVKTGEDRIIKTEFELVTHGYILPDSIVKLDNQSSTTEKSFTPKKLIIKSEIVATADRLPTFNREKWRSPTYPNLPLDQSGSLAK